MKTYEWIVYERADSWEIVGAGNTAAEARRDACENSNCLPCDFGIESWDEANWDDDDAWPHPENWCTATQSRYREALLADQYELLRTYLR